jgi:hypothetical protein
MDSFIRQMKGRVDLMTPDHIIYLFIPEMLYLKDIAVGRGDKKMEEGITEILKYVSEKVELDQFKCFDIPKLVVPSPTAIINGTSPKHIPNN